MEKLAKNRPLSLQEREKIKIGIDNKLSCSQISHQISRGKNTVVVELRRNGGKEIYDPIKAHEMHLDTKRKTDLKRKKSLKEANFNPYISLTSKVDALEMQLEIILELVKELKNDTKNK